MAAAMIYQIFSSSALTSFGVYHMVGSTRSHLKSPQSYTAKPFHPLHHHGGGRLRLLPLYLALGCLLLATAHHCLSSLEPDPLLPFHLFTSLQTAAVCLLFLLLALLILLSELLPSLSIPSDLLFALSAAAFLLLSAASSGQTSGLQAKCDSLSGKVSAAAAILSLALAANPRLFVADLGLGAAVCLQGLWALQTGLSLYVDAFIPEGCHRLLDVGGGIEGSTKCDLEESGMRAAAVLDLAFSLHVVFTFFIMMIAYVVVCVRIGGGGARRLGPSYEPLPTTALDHNHIQMKSMTGTQA